MKKKIFIAVAVILVIAVIAIVAFNLVKENVEQKELLEKHTVTQEQWKAAMAAENFTMSYINVNGDEDVCKFTNEGYISSSSKYGESKYVFIGDNCYELTQSGDTWVAKFSAKADDHRMLPWYMDIFSELVYDGEQNLYVYTDGWDTIEFKFEYGALVSMKFVTVFGDDVAITEYFISNVGTTAITLPEYVIE